MATRTRSRPQAEDHLDAPNGDASLEEAKASDTPEPLVDLDAVTAARDTIRYGEKLYELKSIDELGILDQQKVNRDGREFFKLWSSDQELSATEQQRLTMLLQRLLDMVLDAPRTVKAKLSDAQKAQIVLAFTRAPLMRLAALIQEAQQDEARESDPTTGS